MNSAPVRVSFEGLALAWEGFDKGVDHPLDLRISNVSVTDPNGRRLVIAPDAHVTFSLAGLLLGRLVPRTIEVDHAQVAVTSEAAGPISLGWEPDTNDAANANGGDANGGGDAKAGDGDAADRGMPQARTSDSGEPSGRGLDLRRLRDDLVHPASTDHGRSQRMLDQLRRVHFRDAIVTFRDRESQLLADSSGMDLNLVRAANGRIHGSLLAPLSLGGEQRHCRLHWTWSRNPRAASTFA